MSVVVCWLIIFSAGSPFTVDAEGCCLQSGSDAQFRINNNVLTCNYVTNFQACFAAKYPNACMFTLTDDRLTFATNGCNGLLMSGATSWTCFTDGSIGTASAGGGSAGGVAGVSSTSSASGGTTSSPGAGSGGRSSRSNQVIPVPNRSLGFMLSGVGILAMIFV